MPDFTSSLYLGLCHDSRSLGLWDALTQGRPAALREPPEAVAVARALARLMGAEAGTLAPSTFQLFWDALGVLSREPVEIFMDAATYPIARWGAEHWAGQGVPLHTFAAHDVAALERLLRGSRRGRPVVLADAVSPGGRSQPPLAAYSTLARAHGGWLLLDDTQGLGVLGAAGASTAPWGSGGSGSRVHRVLRGDHVLVGASLAKAFGVPVAVLTGSRAFVQRFERESAGRQHMSPPSMAVIRGAERALQVNAREGDTRRAVLWQRVQRLRASLTGRGLAAQGGEFPVQTLRVPPAVDVAGLHRCLLRQAVATVAHRRHGGTAALSLIVNATHTEADIDTAADVIAWACRLCTARPSFTPH